MSNQLAEVIKGKHTVIVEEHGGLLHIIVSEQDSDGDAPVLAELWFKCEEKK